MAEALLSEKPELLMVPSFDNASGADQNVALHALSAARQSRAIKGSLSYG